MFGIGWSEMLIVGVIALVLLGEDKFPEFVKIAIRAFRDFRGYWEDMRSEVEKEVRAPLQQHLKPLQRELSNLAKAEPTYTPPKPAVSSTPASSPEGAYATTPTDVSDDAPLSQDYEEPYGAAHSEDAKVMSAGAMPYAGGGPGARPAPSPAPTEDAGFSEPVIAPEPADDFEPVDRREPYGAQEPAAPANDDDHPAPPTRID